MNIRPSGASDAYVVETPDSFRVSRRVFVDADVLSREMSHIFERCWLYLGHESEVTNKGDFVVRTVGGHNLIFVRGQDGQVRALFNVCAHRAATVCRDSNGNTKLFRCLYHAWAFDTCGKAVARPDPERYGARTFEGGQDDLRSVPRLDNHRGFYFINYDSASESLKSYLAGAADFLDRLADQSEIGLEVTSGSHKYGVNTNWKGIVENALDFSHVVPLHQTYIDYVARAEGGAVRQPPSSPLTLRPHRSLGNGHVVGETGGRGWGRPVARAAPSWGEAGEKEVAEIVARLEKRFGKEYASKLANHNFNMIVFPNLSINDVMSTNIRTAEPAGVDKVLVNSWSIAPKEESKMMRGFRAKNFLGFLGPGGFATQDDIEALEHSQHGYHNLPNDWNDFSRGITEKEQVQTDEENQRSFFREWNRRMLAD
jgi:p-cumate 2,3-dioxygenase subunit alpha